MPQYDYDLFVIGAGSGGVRAARLAAQCGARVAIAEADRIGGTCVIRGCIPKKLFVYASEYAQHFRDAAGFGWSVEGARFDWPTLRDNVQDEVTRLSDIYRANLQKSGATLIEDRAVLLDAHTIRLERSGTTVAAERILIATGGRTARPPGLKGGEHAIVSEHAFVLDALPKRALIAGGGYIAVEFATIFSGLGVEAMLAFRADKILRGFDEDMRVHVEDDLARTGVKMLRAAPAEITASGAGKTITLTDGTRYEADLVLLAQGREPNTQGLGLEAAGVRLTERGAVAVDAYSRSNVPSIFAVGDVTDRINLTPVAIREAQAFVASEFQNNPTVFDHADVPSAVFSRPPMAAVGLTEARAREHCEVDIYKSKFRPMKHILAGNEQRTLMKLVVRAKDERILGVHIAGPEAAELVQVAAIAVKAGITKPQWDQTCALHPTLAEELVLMRDRFV